MLNSDESDSDESLSMLSLPEYNTPEVNAIPLECWQDICLSKIFIHRRYLPSMKKPLNTGVTQGVFGTLQKWDDQQKIKSFSVYSDSDIDTDSDEDLDLDTEKTKIEDDSTRILSKSIANLSELDSFSVKSNVSLNEILDTTTEAEMCKFELKKFHNHGKSSNKENTESLSKLQSFPVNNEPLNQCSTTEANIKHFELEKLVKYAEPQGKEAETLKSSKKNRNLKKKNKVVKSVTLDKFLEDYTDEDKQVACANNYLQRVLTAKNEDCLDSTKIHLKNRYEFPELTANIEIENQKVSEEKPVATVKRIVKTLPQSDNNENNQTKKEEPTLNTVGKFIIEYIPAEVSHDDIYSLFYGYGEIKKFYVEKDGNFQKAVVQMDLMCEGDWIVECLNGTEPFGASSRALKCYMQ